MCEAIDAYESYITSRAVSEGLGAEASAGQTTHTSAGDRRFLSEHRIGPAPPPRTISTEMMIEWLNENHVLTQIFDVNSHVEMMRRSVPLIKFMARRRALNSDMVDRLWSCVTVSTFIADWLLITCSSSDRARVRGRRSVTAARSDRRPALRGECRAVDRVL